MDVVLESIDMMKDLLHGIRDHGNDTDLGLDITDICARLEAVSNGDEIATVTEEKVEVQAEIPEPAQESPAVEDEDYFKFK